MWEESGAVSHCGHAQCPFRRTTWSRAGEETEQIFKTQRDGPLNKPADHLKGPQRKLLNGIPPQIDSHE